MLLDGRENWVKIVDRYTAGVIFATGYGRRIDSMEAEVIKKKIGFMNTRTFLLAPGRYWVETFPGLKYIPSILALWRRTIEEKSNEEAAFNISLVDFVRSDIRTASKASATDEKRKNITPFTESILSLQSQECNILHLNDRQLAALPGSFFTTGFDTTASTIGSCLLTLITHPHVLALAQIELDALLPAITSPNYTTRSLTFADLPHLPYLTSLILETLRWRPAVPLCLPHASSSESTYQCYIIPAATTAIASTWSLNRDVDFCPSPEVFEPKRFLPPHTPFLAFSSSQRASVEIGCK
jgi:cytochrome P450